MQSTDRKKQAFLMALFVRPTTPRSVGTKGTTSNARAFTLHEHTDGIGIFVQYNYKR
jgi:hypothetical protein